MKRIIIFLILFWVMSLTLAQNETIPEESNGTIVSSISEKNVSYDQLNYMHSLMAIEFNKMALQDNEEFKSVKDLFDNMNPSMISVDSILSILKKNKLDKNAIYTKSLLELGKNMSLESAVISISEDFVNRIPQDFWGKRENRNKEEFKSQVKNKLESYAKTFLPVDNSKQEIKKGEDRNINKSTKGLNALSIILLILFVISLLGNGFLFWKLRISNKELEITIKKKADLKDKLVESVNKIQELQIQNQNKETTCANYKDQIEKLNRQVKNLRLSQGQNHGDRLHSSIEQNSSSVISSPVKKEDFYVQFAEDDVFPYGNSNFTRGEHLYHIISEGDRAEFEFINDRSTIAIARGSRSMFIESACDILNEDQRQFAEIITEQKGQLIRIDNGWKIVKKAQVRLG